MTLECNNCGFKNPLGSRFCGRCGRGYGTPEMERHAEKEREATKARYDLEASMRGKQAYHYGTLWALATEQDEAITQLVAGRLGWWGRNRLPGRAGAIYNQLNAIMRLKMGRGMDITAAGDQILTDIAEIARSGLFGRQYPEGAFAVVVRVIGARGAARR